MPSYEDLLKERLAQLDEISERRNGLLRQLFDLARGEKVVCSTSTGEPRGKDEEVSEFLSQLDLRNGVDNGSITTLPDSWFQFPSPSDLSDATVEVGESTSPREDHWESSPPVSQLPISVPSSSRTPSPMVIEDVIDYIELKTKQDERRGSSHLKSATISPRSYTRSPGAEESVYGADLTERSPPSRSPSPVDVPGDSVSVEVSGDNIPSPLEYELDQDVDQVAEETFQEPEDEEIVVLEQLPDEPVTPEAEIEVEEIVEEEEDVPFEQDLDFPSPRASPAAEEADNYFVDEDIVPPTPTPELEDSAHASPEMFTQLTPPPGSMESTLPFEPNSPLEEASYLDDMEDARSHSSAEADSPRTPSPFSPTLVSISTYGAQSSRPVIQVPSPIHEMAFNFDDEPIGESSSQANKSPTDSHVYFNPHYTIPPLNWLPPEFHRKKSARQQRKRDKEKDRGESRKDDWIPFGMNKWRALLRANPTWKHVAKSSKSLTTKDWNVALTELRLIRTFDRIEMLKDNGRWSFRQPKKQRGVGGLVKTHWDYLMDEMKWMRIDFREERKWQVALAYTLANAVQEWHAAGSIEERVRRGICFIWPRTQPDDVCGVTAEEEDTNAMIVDEEPDPRRSVSMQIGDYGSDDGSDDDQDKDQADVIDALDMNGLVQDVQTQSDHVELKIEDADDFPSSLQMQPDAQEQTMDPDSGHSSSRQDSQDNENENDPVPSGLKPTSQNPVLQATNNRAAITAATIYLREKIAYSDTGKLFLDLDDFELEESADNSGAVESVVDVFPSFPDLSVLFPDLQPYGLLDVVPATIQLDGKKNRRERDDPNRRAEDTTYSKLTPVSKFMHCRPTLVGPLQPSKHWKGDKWDNLDDLPIHPSEVFKQHEPNLCALFERSVAISLVIKPPDKRGQEPRIAEQLWTPNDDMILKSLVEFFHSNWLLTADALNTSRRSVSTDRRTAWDCYHRWMLLSNKPESDPSTQPVAGPSVRPKRLATMNAAESAAASSNTNLEARKRRRHLVMQDAIRKVARKREAVAKAAANQKRQTVVHDTHGQYNRMPKVTPQELGQRKIEKEYQDRLNRQRSEELRTKALREQQARIQQGGQTIQSSGIARTTGNGLQTSPAVPQIRSQVNISQQQRISNPIAAVANARLSPQHAMQAQVRAMAAAQQAQGQAQTQGQSQPQNGQAMTNSHLSPTLSSLSYTNRSSSSPSMSQASPPPRAPSTTGTPAPISSGTPRPPSTQPLLGAHPGHAQMPNAMVRPAPTGMSSLPHYYGNVNMGSQQFTTTEQMEQALRLQSMIQARQRQQVPQAIAASTQLPTQSQMPQPGAYTQ